MKRKWLRLLTAAAPVALLLLAATSARAVTGAIYTTDGTCTGNNINIFATKDDVFLDGGPKHGGSGLPDGYYYCRVTKPNGDLLGTSIGSGNDTPIHVTGGDFDQCYKLSVILVRASNGTPGYDTNTAQGEYKVWVSTDAGFVDQKTDNFKVGRQSGGGGPSGCGVAVSDVELCAGSNCTATLVTDPTSPDYAGPKASGTGCTVVSATPTANLPLQLGPNNISWEVVVKNAGGTPETFTVPQIVTVKYCGNGGFTNCPVGPITANVDPSLCAATATWTPPTPNDECALDGAVTSNHSPGDTFPLGTTHVVYSAVWVNGATATCEFDVVVLATISGTKFYDASADGIQNGAETGLDGIKIELWSGDGLTLISSTYTAGGGLFAFHVAAGSYLVKEVLPGATWAPTTSTSAPITVDKDTTCPTAQFGNVCLGAGGGLTLGFWSNKNGQALTTAGDLACLSAMNLIQPKSTAPFWQAFDPTTTKLLSAWLLNGNATNMAYMLSVQLAAMKLNVLHSFVSASALIYAPGTNSANPAGFATVGAIIAEANASLLANPYTVAAGTTRTYQEALKNALDKANNNLNFVQSSACSFTTPY